MVPVQAVLVAALVFAGALSIGGIVIGMFKTDLDDEFWLEVARAGVQVLAVVVIGGAVAAAWRYLEQERSDQQKRLADERERQRQLHEQQLAVFRQIVESYNEVKAIRRTLRSIGLREATGTMSETQVGGFRELMMRLNLVQLAFEALKRELGETDFFKEDTAEIVKRLYYIESHLKQGSSGLGEGRVVNRVWFGCRVRLSWFGGSHRANEGAQRRVRKAK